MSERAAHVWVWDGRTYVWVCQRCDGVCFDVQEKAPSPHMTLFNYDGVGDCDDGVVQKVHGS